MTNEETVKHHWLKIGAIALMTFIIAFLAFYIVMEIMINRLNNPIYQVKRFEKNLAKQERRTFYGKRHGKPFCTKNATNDG